MHKADMLSSPKIKQVQQSNKAKWSNKKIPQHLWDYGIVYEAEVLSCILRGHLEHPRLEELTGNTIDISERLDFSFYDLQWGISACHENHSPSGSLLKSCTLITVDF